MRSLSAGCLLLLASGAAAQPPDAGRDRAAVSDAARLPSRDDRAARPAPRTVAVRVPQFGDLPSVAGPPARSAPVVLATPQAMRFRTRLRAAAAERPNFAGHYVLTTWGCGTGCASGAVVNLRNGRVTFVPSTTILRQAGDPRLDLDSFEFRADSRLLVLNGVRNGEPDESAGSHYYRIEGDRFVLLRDLSWFAPGR